MVFVSLGCRGGLSLLRSLLLPLPQLRPQGPWLVPTRYARVQGTCCIVSLCCSPVVAWDAGSGRRSSRHGCAEEAEHAELAHPRIPGPNRCTSVARGTQRACEGAVSASMSSMPPLGVHPLTACVIGSGRPTLSNSWHTTCSRTTLRRRMDSCGLHA